MSKLRRQSVNSTTSMAQRIAIVSVLSTLVACSTRLDNAPVIDRSPSAGIGAPTTQMPPPGTLQTAPAPEVAAPLPPAPPGYYRVKPGDTLYRIALVNGRNYRDVAAWNNITNPNQIEVDQLLRVAPPGSNPPMIATAPGAIPAPPSPYGPANNGVTPPAPVAQNGAPASNAPPPVVAAPSTSANTPVSNGAVSFAWPAKGPILHNFDAQDKGVDIGGAPGDAVRASSEGRVVYAGNGLRGYGNLIIIKHDATFLTAYAHNRALLVKEGDAVTKGQKIAEMGNTDADTVMLHFEVRKQGKPVDPLQYLPPQ
ncbi:peptidoglycan DD-metalloendopeptidase family protein [Pararobbsia silviterrae]|uniref:LysM peptidoglycan-binding domain-containing protein n=1 Tax=Pararobbsia silviterrae TaxID=1792498 RepID=A0A494XXY4_9BURK|nr:peptidoglycan DD-metalloendopeptidase family protein [Pararobbsia silviterrae]RKP54594.1 LysM peptidoglycan-binding domain-containing protein [Pararobbsia silviterrae]